LSKLEKLLERVKNNPKAVRFEELDKLLIRQALKEGNQAKVQAIIITPKETKRFPFRSRSLIS
jgi:hypothetical protein